MPLFLLHHSSVHHGFCLLLASQKLQGAQVIACACVHLHAQAKETLKNASKDTFKQGNTLYIC
eukprot:1158747-Pelagomonas_calceolata.AAC.8